MNRRTFLNTVACGSPLIAGCAREPAPSTDTSTSKVTPSTTTLETDGASLEIDAALQDDTIVAGDEIEVEVTITNTGGATGQIDLTLELDGEVTARETVQAPANEEVSVFLSTTIDKIEPMSVSVNGQHIRDIFPTVPDRSVIHVASDGDDTNAGTEAAPLATIQEGIERAKPGSTVYAHPGRYFEGVQTVRDGKPDQPITITGPPSAIYHRSFDIFHSHVHITGLTFDGLRDRENTDVLDSYASHNIICNPIRNPDEDSYNGYIEDILIKPYAVGNTQSSCIDCKWANDVEIGEFEVIGPAGLVHLVGGRWGHNGEIIYIGRPFNKWLDPDEPPEERLDLDEFPVDESHNYHIHHIKHTAGHPHTELVDAKTGSYNVLIEYCTDIGGHGYYRLHDEKPPSDEASFHIGGLDVTLRWSVIEDGRGAGVRIGNSGLVDEMDDLVNFADDSYPGTNNAVYGNRLLGNEGNAVEFPSIRHEAPFDNGPAVQKTVCGNDYDGETMGEPDKACPDWVPDGDGIGHLGGESPWT